MAVDVTARINIERPQSEVSAFAADPDNVPKWYVNIRSVEWKTARPAVVGSRIAFVANFLGRRLEYTHEIVELVPGERLVKRTAEGPFPMETTYEWSTPAPGTTHMTLRNRGEPSGFGALVAPMMAFAMKRATQKDLERLKNQL